MSLIWRTSIAALLVVLGCRREPALHAVAPRPSDGLAPWRYLVDELAVEGSRERRPIAAIGEITRYVLVPLPTVQLTAPANAPRSVPVRDGGVADVVLECPPQLAGRPVALRLAAGVSAFFANARLDAPSSAWCPAGTGEPLTVPLGGLPAVPTVSATIPVLATGEPVPRVETRWLRVPAGAVLEVTFGMADPAKTKAVPAARFAIHAEGRDGSSVMLLERAVAAAEAAPRRDWFRERIALGSLAERLGAEMRFVFETTVAESDRPAFPVWGDPVILTPASPPSIARRNIVLVSLDTLRADRLGCYGAVGGNTPTLDRLASEGTLFEQAIAAAPWTSPSHATLLTGFHGCVHRLGIENRREMVAGIVPLPELLRDAGYATAAFTEGGYMNPVSFQRGFGTFTAPGEFLAKRPWGDIDRTVGDATRWLGEEAREPFFLFVHTYEVHAPYNAPPPYGDLLGPADGALASRAPKERAREDLARYDEEVRYTDSVMGRLLAALQEPGLARRTIVVIVADHGEAFGEHGYFNHVTGLDEEILRVPFIWFAPGLIAAGRRIPTVAGLIDVPSTLLDLVGLPSPPVIEGRSLAPLLRDVDPPVDAERERIVFAEQMLLKSPYPIVARAQSWRATLGAGGGTDVFTVDRGRGARVAPDSPLRTLAAAARAQYEDACQRTPTLMPTAPAAAQPAVPDPDQQERLRALGYVD